MSDKENQRAQEEQLKKLEEEAYFELCQIIAEALQLQDIKVLNSKLASWKIKYKKLLDGSTPNSSLIEKIKRLQSDDYIGYIIDMIMQRIKITEYVKIENQAKALRKLYSIIKETNDFKTLKNKIEDWKKTYPIQSFMKMYQKKVAYYTRTKTLEDNSFDQEKAFNDLIQITKITGKPDEFKRALDKWEETYNIHDKFELDDFIKNQSEVKRYVQEIESKANPEQQNAQTPAQETSKQFSDITKQTLAVDALISIINGSNNLNKVFDWVHKNASIKFNDEFKALILSKTALQYSPKYLNQLKVPNINVLSGSLSFDEYKKIDDIKRYAIISYFNLLLPKEQAIPNNYFDNYVEDIYYKSKNVKITDKLVNPKIVVENNDNTLKDTKPTLEIEPKNSSANLKDSTDTMQELVENELEDTTVSEPELPTTELESEANVKQEAPQIVELVTEANEKQKATTIELDSDNDTILENTETPQEQEFITLDDLEVSFEQQFDEYPNSFEIDLSTPTDWQTISPTEDSTHVEDTGYTTIDLDQNIDTVNEEIDILGYSPLFFDSIYSLSVQANLIQKVDKSVEQFEEPTKSENSIDIERNKTDN